MEFTDSDGNQLSYRLVGQGPMLIMVHGYGGAPTNWHSMVEILEKHFSCYLINLTKLYYSRDPKVDIDAIVKLLTEFVKDCRKKQGAPILLCGNSFGATLLQKVVLNCNNCVKKFVLIGPMPRKPLTKLRDPILRLITIFGRFKSLNYFLLKSWMGGIIYPYLSEIWRLSDTPRKDKRKIKSWKDFGERKIRLLVHAITRFCDLNAKTNWSQMLPRSQIIPTKSLIIWGGYDRLWRFGTPEKIRKRFQNCSLNFVHDAGHLVMVDQPVVCAQYVELFLMDHPHSR